jgi:glycopeptide antibiotics resistance protein
LKKRLGWILFLAYVLFLLWLTILSRQPRVGERVFKWELLWAYRAWIAGESFGKTESIQNINNILVFIPFGALFPGKRWRALLLIAVLFSVGIEVIQYAFNLGWCEIDDVICNVLGAAIGVGLWKLIKGKMHAV